MRRLRAPRPIQCEFPVSMRDCGSVTILKLMTDPNVPAAVRLRAAECVFDRAIKGIELEDIEARVAALEQASEENKSGGRR